MTEEKPADGTKGAGEPSMEEILASIRRIIAEDSDKPAKDEPERPPSKPGWASVLDLTEMVNADGSVTSLKSQEDAPAGSPPPDEAEASQPETDLPMPSDTQSPQPESPRGGTLFSELIAQKTKAAFAKVEEASRPPEPPLPPAPDHDGRTIDAFLSAMLEPMLQEWLEKNLPAIVERLVAEELARISSRARG